VFISAARLDPDDGWATAFLDILSRCQAGRVRWILELPRKSPWGSTAEVRTLSGLAGVIRIDCDWCAFGDGGGRRSTFLCGGFVDQSDLDPLDRTCHSVGGVCSFSRRPHRQATGPDPAACDAGRPARLRRTLGQILVSHLRYEFMNASPLGPFPTARVGVVPPPFVEPVADGSRRSGSTTPR
jgi:hypothetical protein